MEQCTVHHSSTSMEQPSVEQCYCSSQQHVYGTAVCGAVLLFITTARLWNSRLWSCVTVRYSSTSMEQPSVEQCYCSSQQHVYGTAVCGAVLLFVTAARLWNSRLWNSVTVHHSSTSMEQPSVEQCYCSSQQHVYGTAVCGAVLLFITAARLWNSRLWSSVTVHHNSTSMEQPSVEQCYGHWHVEDFIENIARYLLAKWLI